MLGTHPRFQKYADAQEAKAARERAAGDTGKTVDRILQLLPKRSTERFENLRSRCVELRQIAQGLRDPHAAEPPPLDEMQMAGRRIGHIVADLKDFARREDAPRLEPVDVDAVARAAVRLVENRIAKATSRFQVELEPGLPRVRGNAQRIEQVIVNLLLNACEALPEPGRGVWLATRRDAARRVVVVEVRDEGVGIPEEHLSRLTDPFFTTKRESGGTGLGLSVSAGIVKEHGGTLEFRSRPGAGTTVVLTFPALPPEAT